MRPAVDRNFGLFVLIIVTLIIIFTLYNSNKIEIIDNR